MLLSTESIEHQDQTFCEKLESILWAPNQPKQYLYVVISI